MAHLASAHPEMAGQEELIALTLSDPDRVVRSEVDPEVDLYHRMYSHPVVGEKYLLAVVKCVAGDCFLVTAHFTDRVKRGAVTWTRN